MEKKKIGVSELAAFNASLAIPWCLKPLYGFISDTFPCCGLRRKPYIIACNGLCIVLWVLMGHMDPSIGQTQCILLLISTLTCFSDVMYDSILVRLAKKEEDNEHGSRQSTCWAARAFGGLIASAVSGYLLTSIPQQSVFLIEAAFHGLVVLFAFRMIREKPPPVRPGGGAWKRFRRRWTQLWRAFQNPSLYKPALFVFLFGATPSSSTALFYFLVNKLHFSTPLLGFLTCVRHGAMLVGTIVYRRYLRHVPFRKFFCYMVVISTIAGASPIILVTHFNQTLGLPNAFFAAGDDLFLSVFGQIALMPCLVLAAKLCPLGIEASLYAFFVSILNFSGIVSEYGGSLLTYLLGVTTDNFDHLVSLIALCTASTLLTLCALPLLPLGGLRELDCEETNDLYKSGAPPGNERPSERDTVSI
jgi:folate/biopterin transporter